MLQAVGFYEPFAGSSASSTRYIYYLGAAEKVFRGGRVWGVGCGVWGFTHFQVVNYLIFREKIPKFSPQSLQW
ncbi:hypothetical protein O53_2580 [Microcystis aeruginosa TAIHU98]|uniref:Type IV pilin PilA n=1 Tax=Microcystis aeruginosa TAIHU98 TaxID=1134457 RepID=L7E553_MICAE|nr:hypothetical protein O53_2580 [Microcystis aeruginosa TAIHU98]ROI12310.1 hypothetical protein ED562_02300 [Microcystis aeruginosa FACHB-524]